MRFEQAAMKKTVDFRSKGTTFGKTINRIYGGPFVADTLDPFIRKIRVYYLYMFGHTAAACLMPFGIQG